MSGQAATIRSSERSVPLVAGGAATGGSAGAAGEGAGAGAVEAGSAWLAAGSDSMGVDGSSSGRDRGHRCRRLRFVGRRRWAVLGRRCLCPRGWRRCPRGGLDHRLRGPDRWRRRAPGGLDRGLGGLGRGCRHGRGSSCGIGLRAGEQRKLQLEAEAADASTVRIDGDEPAGDGGQGGTTIRATGTGLRDEPRANGFDDLVQQRARVAAALFESVEDLDARGGVAGQQRLDESLDGRGVRETEQVANGRLGHDIGRHREQLVEDRLGVAHPASGQTRDEREGFGLDRSAVRFEDPRQLALDLRDGEAPDVEALKP